ncbi:MAG: DUF3368 domain-containing protein, partial [Pirellulales bacterium]
GCFDLLQVASPKIVIPTAVAGELQRRGASDPTVQAFEQASWATVEADLPVPPLIQAWDLGPGESAVLAWAYARAGTEAILDDLAARRCAAALGIPLRGTLGLLLTAKKRGLISAARPILERMRRAGMYLSDEVLNQALSLVDE